jgi:hypothetical protein
MQPFSLPHLCSVFMFERGKYRSSHDFMLLLLLPPSSPLLLQVSNLARKRRRRVKVKMRDPRYIQNDKIVAIKKGCERDLGSIRNGKTTLHNNNAASFALAAVE